jgi:hypothetical protein
MAETMAQIRQRMIREKDRTIPLKWSYSVTPCESCGSLNNIHPGWCVAGENGPYKADE